MKVLTGIRRSMLTAAAALVFIVIAMLAGTNEAYAGFDGLNWATFDGSRVVWDEATEYDDNWGSAYECMYSLYIIDASTEETLKSYKDLPVHTTSKDLTDDLLNDSSLMNRSIKCKVIAYSYTEEYGSNPAIGGPVKYHKVNFRIEPVNYKQGIAFAGGHVDRVTAPEVGGKDFIGWYTDPEFTQIWDFGRGEMPDSDLTLYGRYIDEGQHQHDGATYKPWASDTSLPDTAGHYYLVQDVHLKSDWNPPDGVDLCLNGKTISSETRAIAMNNGDATLHVRDCSEDHTGTITGCVKSGVLVDAGTVIWHSGNIKNNQYDKATPYEYGGGGVTLQGGTFEFISGEISGNYSAGNGGGVRIGNGTFIMRGGIITGNSSHDEGAGIAMRQNAHFEISGGSIKDNNGIGLWQCAQGENSGPITIIPAEGSDTADDIIITGNSQNVFLEYGANLNFVPIKIQASLSDDTLIGVSVYRSFNPGDGAPRKITSGFYGKAAISNFFSDNSNYELETAGEGTSTEAALKVRHKITFNGNGAEGEMDEVTIVDGHDLDLPDNGFTVKNGYRFGGWRIGEEVKQPGEPLENVIHDTTVYAAWTPIQYTLEYDLDGGALPEGEENPASYNIETSDIHLVNPIRLGYDFLGWTWEGQETPDDYVVIRSGMTGDKSFTANWELIEYTLTYDLNGGKLEDGKTNPDSLNVETETFTLNNPVRDGNLFRGWYIKGSDGEPEPIVTIAKGSVGARSYIAMWQSAYRVQVDPGTRNGTIKVSKTTSLGNEEIELTVIPDEHYECFKRNIRAVDSSGNDIDLYYTPSSNRYTFDMPEDDVFISADFTPVMVSSISVQTYADGVYLTEGNTSAGNVVAVAWPSDALNRILDWEVLDPEIATIDDQHYVHAHKIGGTSIVITAQDGSGVKKYVQVFVTDHGNRTLVPAEPPACEEDGTLEHYKCDECGSLFLKNEDGSYKEVTEEGIVDPATGHDWSEWTELDENSHKRTCRHNEEHFEIEDHTWDDGEITKQPTAEAEGEKTYTCTACGGTKTEAVPNLAERLAAAEKALEDAVNASEEEKRALQDEIDRLKKELEEAKKGGASEPTKEELKNAKVNTALNIKATSISTTAKTKRKQMIVTWKKSSGAANYLFAYRQAGKSKWTEKWTGGKTKLIMSKMKKNGLYEFRILAVKKSGSVWQKSKWSKVNYRFFANTKQKVKAGKKSVTVKVSKVKKASGYEVLYGTTNTLNKMKVKAFKGTRRTSLKVKKLKSKKTYYIMSRPYKKYKGRKYIGILNKAVKVKVK